MEEAKKLARIEATIEELAKRIDKIEMKVENLPKIEYIMETIQKSFEEQSRINKEVSETIMLINTNLKSQLDKQEENKKEITSLSQRLDAIDDKSKIDMAQIGKESMVDFIKKVLLWLIGAVLAMYFMNK